MELNTQIKLNRNAKIKKHKNVKEANRIKQDEWTGVIRGGNSKLIFQVLNAELIKRFATFDDLPCTRMRTNDPQWLPLLGATEKGLGPVTIEVPEGLESSRPSSYWRGSLCTKVDPGYHPTLIIIGKEFLPVR